MASITIRNLSDEDKKSLKIKAAQNDQSLEAYVRDMIKNDLSVNTLQRMSLADAFKHFFGEENGVELELPPREEDHSRPIVTFD